MYYYYGGSIDLLLAAKAAEKGNRIGNMIDTVHAIGIIGVTAVCTFLLRGAPFLIFGGKKEVPELILYLGKVLPPAIMATLVVYCLKGMDLMGRHHGLPEILSVGLVAVLHLWKKNILLTVGSGTLCYMYLVQNIFV